MSLWWCCTHLPQLVEAVLTPHGAGGFSCGQWAAGSGQWAVGSGQWARTSQRSGARRCARGGI